MDDKIQQAREMALANRQVSVYKIASFLNISHGSAHQIIHEETNLFWLPKDALWGPQFSTNLRLARSSEKVASQPTKNLLCRRNMQSCRLLYQMHWKEGWQCRKIMYTLEPCYLCGKINCRTISVDNFHSLLQTHGKGEIFLANYSTQFDEVCRIKIKIYSSDCRKLIFDIGHQSCNRNSWKLPKWEKLQCYVYNSVTQQ